MDGHGVARRNPSRVPAVSHDFEDDTFDAFVAQWNAAQDQAYPKLHKTMVCWLEKCWRENAHELLLMAFRNSGKSTLVGLFCAWMLSRDPTLRIMVLAADLALARKMTRNVKRIIERHPRCAGLKPKRADQWASDQFTVNREGELRDPSMLAKGISANVTGSRADIVICDDVEVPNTCDSPQKRADLRQRLDEIDYVIVPGGVQLYIGTPHTYYTIYAETPRLDAGEEVPFLSAFKRLELAVLDEDGHSRWPERYPLEKIARMRLRSGPNKFESQMMLRPANYADGRLDPDLLRRYDEELLYVEGNATATLRLGARRLVSASCWWDPAYGAPGKGDASVIACVFTDEEGSYWLHRVAYLQHDPDRTAAEAEAIQLCRQVAIFVEDLHLPSITLETNGIGRFLPGLLRRTLAERGVACAVVERASRTSKTQRIIDAFDAPLAAGTLHAHAGVWSTPFIAEMREWRPGAKMRDDGLDAVSGCLLDEPVRLSRRPLPGRKDLRARWRSGATPHKAVTDFSV
ncbi:phage terminase large subunit [Varunaivibrio sulfuroxidans]|uniref:Phage terminase large subunit-like protein n=1 Tax=Varunaivibrio sulfuroxidans TaxID=1773489 RepID=A0A4R3J8A6_9PROT|nr:phage terminase large subunit [Varunaivibrio sulfuroxidans]TCS61684.1 hypothetical protein EDD55_10793 [Varunaivibrio sulfuroxidans]WES32133.1 phage terminase large subunit [Varunaivibrio sulfuroxidans]